MTSPHIAEIYTDLKCSHGRNCRDCPADWSMKVHHHLSMAAIIFSYLHEKFDGSNLTEVCSACGPFVASVEKIKPLPPPKE
jgi:hypothetical protein